MADPVSDRLLAVQYRLTGRDLVLLGWLAEHKTLTTAQIAHALFPTARVAQERLLKLTRAGILARFRPFRDVGTNPYHYLLTQLGEEIAAVQDGRTQPPRRDQARRRRWQLTNRTNLPHLLAVNQFFIDLAAHARTHPGTRLERWWSSAHCQRPDSFSDLWPEGTRSADLYNATIAADGHGIWTTTHTATGPRQVTRVPFFLEVDLGTEDHTRLNAKLIAYQKFTVKTGYTWPVLFWFTSARRERNFHDHLDAHLNPALSAALRATLGTGSGDVGPVPVATAARDRTGDNGMGPADDVWWLHAQPHYPRNVSETLLGLNKLTFTIASPQFDTSPTFKPFAPADPQR